LDELVSKLRAAYPQYQISSPLLIDEESDNPSLIATWSNFGPVVLPRVDYVILTKPGTKERWPAILGHIPFEELQKILGTAIQPIELDGNSFFVLPQLEPPQIEGLKTALHPGLPESR
jgi:hypothetical protein